MDALYRPPIPNDTVELIHLYIGMKPNLTHQDYVDALTEKDNPARAREIHHGIQWLIQNDYVRVDKRTLAITIRG